MIGKVLVGAVAVGAVAFMLMRGGKTTTKEEKAVNQQRLLDIINATPAGSVEHEEAVNKLHEDTAHYGLTEYHGDNLDIDYSVEQF